MGEMRDNFEKFVADTINADFEAAFEKRLAGRARMDVVMTDEWSKIQKEAADEVGLRICPHCEDYGVHDALVFCMECHQDFRCEDCHGTGWTPSEYEKYENTCSTCRG